MTLERSFDQIEETLYEETLDNGLTVCVLPKPDFYKTYATFTTNYGSVDQTFVPLGQSKQITVPDGIAHFLEHKMFEDEEGDVFHTFGKQGASANAFTSFTRTAYLFSSTQEVMKNLETLLNFVQHPYFTEKSVEKEKGIIGQEITMYDDNPDWRLFFNLLDNLYQNHPVKIDIAGTIDSIDKITKEDLYTCYETFYHPANMVFFVVGPVNPAKVFELVKENQNRKSFAEPEEVKRSFAEEPSHVNKEKSVLEMSISTPKCLVGFKESDIHRHGTDMLKHELSVQIALEILFGQGSEAYEEMYRQGFIDDSFSSDYTSEKTFAFSVIGGDTPKPDKLADFIIKTIKDAATTGCSEEAFKRVKKKKIGSFLKQLNSPEFIANQFTRYRFNDMELFEVLPTLENISVNDINHVFQHHFRDEQRSISQVVAGEGSTKEE